MKLTVITPVGPGHQDCVQRAIESVRDATNNTFSRITHAVIDDTQGIYGRSHARNSAMDDSDWYFFLDADDTMERDAPDLLKRNYSATFGSIKLGMRECRRKIRVSENNILPCGWKEIDKHGASGTLCMGFFVKAEVAKSLRFDESLDFGEDFDFYMRLPDFIKIAEPLVTIGYNVPSATGPRGYENIDWLKVCRERIDYYLDHHAVLETSGRTETDPGKLRTI